MIYDGSIKIDTSLDSEGLFKGLAEMEEGTKKSFFRLEGLVWAMTDSIAGIGLGAQNAGALMEAALGASMERLVLWAKDTLNQLPSNVKEALGMVLSAIDKWNVEALNWISAELPKLISEFVLWFLSLPGKVFGALMDVLTKMGEWIPKAVLWAKEEMPKIIASILRFFSELPGCVGQVGIDLIKGLWNGIASMVGWIGIKIKEFCNSILDGFKKGLKEHSPSKATEEMGVYLDEGLAIGIKKGTSGVLDTIEGQKEQIIKLYGEIAEEAGKKVDLVLKQQKTIADKLKGYGALFETSTVTIKGMGENGEDIVRQRAMLRDLSKDTEQLQQYHDALAAVRERGAGEELFSKLRESSVEEGLAFAGALLGASDAEFEEYIENFEKKQKAAYEIAKSLTKTETTQLIDHLTTELQQAGLTVPESFFDSGKTAAENFGEGFMTKFGEVMNKISAAVSVSMSAMAPRLSVAGGYFEAASGNYSYSPTYNIYDAVQSVQQQLEAVARVEKINKFRGRWQNATLL